MRRPIKTALLAVPSVFLGGFLVAHPQSEKAPASSEDRDRLLAIGKKLFVDRCARCHDERGDKPLSSGLPLSERGLSDADITRTVAGRFKDAPDGQKRAVALYVGSLMKKK